MFIRQSVRVHCCLGVSFLWSETIRPDEIESTSLYLLTNASPKHRSTLHIGPRRQLRLVSVGDDMVSRQGILILLFDIAETLPQGTFHT